LKIPIPPLPPYDENPLFSTSFTPHYDNPGFFPGAGGFFNGHKNPNKRLLFFGTDFGTRDDYKKVAKDGGELDSVPTIRNLRETLSKAGVSLDDCFLTNAVLCLRKVGTATDDFPIWQDYPEYVRKCVEWHLNFINDNEHKPKLIVLMGKPHLDHFGKLLYPELADRWAGMETLKSVYETGKELVHLSNGPDLLLMYHPSSWHYVPVAIKNKTVEHLKRYSRNTPP